MKKSTNKKRRYVILLVAVISGLVYLFAKPHLNRLLDNRDKASMTKQILSMQHQIQTEAISRGSYPTEVEVKSIVSSYFSPHTNRPYEYISNVTDYSQVSDSQIAYGYGGEAENCFGDSADKKSAHLIYGIDLPRVNETGVGCETFNLSDLTSKKINYELSCKTNWLGFRTSCDKSLLK